MSNQTETQFKQDSAFTANLQNLPILKHFSADEISTNVEGFRKGEKSIYWFLKLAALIGVGYLTWVYVLPPIFRAIGQYLAIGVTGVLLVFTVLAAPAILKLLRLAAKNLSKFAIKSDPFGQLDIERDKMIANQAQFRVAKGKIASLKNEMEVEADKSEKDAEAGQTKILTLQGKAARIKTTMDAMIAKGGAAAKGDDEYVNNAADLQKILADASRVANQLTQSKDFVTKYGSRAAIMKKMGQKLVMVETAMDIKIADFDATVDMLKKDYEFGQKANQATTAAKSAMGFTKGWEFDYALDVVTSTIAADIATTAGNLKDIDTLTSNYTLDSDELYTNLNQIADKIKVGTDVVPSAKKYENPDYQLTSDDKVKSGGFGDIF